VAAPPAARFRNAAQPEAEEALRRSDERYRAILEPTTDALLIIDAGITWASPASRQVYGVAPADLIGTSSRVVDLNTALRLRETPGLVAQRPGEGASTGAARSNSRKSVALLVRAA